MAYRTLKITTKIGGIYEQNEMQAPLCDADPVPAVGLHDGNHGLCCRHRRCGRSGGKHLGHGIHADQDRRQQRGVSRH